MSTTRIDRILGELVANGRELHEGSCPSLLVEEARSIESELESAKARIAKLESELEAHAWTVSPAMAQARIDQMTKRIEALEKAGDAMARRLGPYCLETVLWNEAKEVTP